MQTCKLFFAFILLNAFLCGTIFAQNTAPTAPSMPAAPTAPVISPIAPMQMPAMPSIAAPVSGSGFYTPGKQYVQNGKPQEKQEEQKIEKSVASSALEQMLTGGTAINNFSGLSAWDLNQLAEKGAIGNLSSLGNTNLSSANQQQILNQILTELKQIKETQKNLSAAPVGAKPSNLPPKILRFIVNSGNILSSCTNIYFSEQENDGTFLLTGDVRTLVENETIPETFYLLFKAEGTKNSKISYNVIPTLLQSKPYSTPLKTFCSATNLTATRTGNLVMLHYSENTEEAQQNFDLLLDIGTMR